MTDNGHPDDLLAPYVIEACPPDEARLVAEHASRCPACAAKIAELSRVAEWIGVATATAPAPELRSRVLSAALAARPAGRPTIGSDSGAERATPVANRATPVASRATPGANHVTPVAGRATPATAANRAAPGSVGDSTDIHRLLEPYRVQVEELDRLLSGLSQPEWLLAAGPHRSVRDMMVHLRDNDGSVAAAAGAHPPTLKDVRLGWRGQAHAIMDVVAGQGLRLLQRQVGLAGRGAIQRPVREALVQRGFETWIHSEDIRAALRLPAQAPSAQQVADIVDLTLRLLPAAMDAAGRAYPHAAIRLVLTGEGGGSRLVELSASPVARTVVAEVSLPAESFCRMAAGRLIVTPAIVKIDGDSRAANDFLAVVATMGCD